MILSVLLILALAGFIIVILSALTPPRAALWVAVLLLYIMELLRLLPLGPGVR